MTHIMLDLETLGTASNAAILSIGAVEFRPETSQVTRKFEVIVDPQSCVDAGLKIDVSTILWWLEQDNAAREQFRKPKIPLQQALHEFSKFALIGSNVGSVKIWGNGATFDNVIMANAYQATRLERPWKYYNDMCFRTMKKLYPNVHQDPIGISHRAVDDAEFQARLLMKIFVQAGIKNV